MASRGVFFGVGAAVGVLTAGVALGVGELVAAFVRPVASPVVAVGDRAVELTPGPVKDWAIRTFGTSDKAVLIAGILVILGLAAVVTGALALRHVAYGLGGIAAFTALGCYCAVSASGGRGGDVVPTLVGGLAGAIALWILVLRAGGLPHPVAGRGPAAWPLADRRAFLQAGALTAALAAVTGVGGRATLARRFDADKARRTIVLPAPASPAPPLTGHPDLGKSGVPWRTPNTDFYRIDTVLSVPQIDPDSWTLRIHGMVDHPITLTYRQLLARPLIERWVTLCCVSNNVGGSLVGNAKFLGAPLRDLMREAGVRPGTEQLVMTSEDGMTIGCPSAVALDGRDSMLAVGMNGVPLPVEHGFPVRVVVPGLYGYVSACKWVVDIAATTFADKAYWVQDGYLQHPPIELESRIDRPYRNQLLPVGRPVAIAGVAWDQHVGVSAVRVQVSGPGTSGEWLDARLGSVPSTDTWRQWVVAWTPPAAGTYTLRVRAVDGAGKAQSTIDEPPYPEGATGLDTITVRAR